jgi:hypothetical protein
MEQASRTDMYVAWNFVDPDGRHAIRMCQTRLKIQIDFSVRSLSECIDQIGEVATDPAMRLPEVNEPVDVCSGVMGRSS